MGLNTITSNEQTDEWLELFLEYFEQRTDENMEKIKEYSNKTRGEYYDLTNALMEQLLSGNENAWNTLITLATDKKLKSELDDKKYKYQEINEINNEE